MLSTWEVFVAAGTPILKVIVIALTGAFCRTEYAGILTPEGLKSLSRIIIMILVPCFLFTKLASVLTFEKLGEWWLICGFGEHCYHWACLPSSVCSSFKFPAFCLKTADGVMK